MKITVLTSGCFKRITCFFCVIVCAAVRVSAGNPPVLTNTNMPADASAFLGQSPVLSVAVSSATPVAFQWRFNDADIGGETNQTLTLVGAVTNESGFFSVVITNDSGSVTSREAQVTVTEPSYGNLKAVVGLQNLTAYRGLNQMIVNGTVTGDSVNGNIWGNGHLHG